MHELLILTAVLTSRETRRRFLDHGPHYVDRNILHRLLDVRERDIVAPTIDSSTLDSAVDIVRAATRGSEDAWWGSLEFLTARWASLASEARALVAPRFPVELLSQPNPFKALPQNIPAWDLHLHLGWSVDFHVVWFAVVARAVWSGGWRDIDEKGEDWLRKRFPSNRTRLSTLVEECRKAVKDAGGLGPRDSLEDLRLAWGHKLAEMEALQKARRAMEDWLRNALQPASESDLRQALRSYIVNAGICRRALLSYREAQGEGLDPFRKTFDRANRYRKFTLYKILRQAALFKQRPAEEWRRAVCLRGAAAEAPKLRWERRLLRICIGNAHTRKMDGIEVRTSLDLPPNFAARQVRAFGRAVIDAFQLCPSTRLRVGVIVSFMKGEMRDDRQKIVKDAEKIAGVLTRLLRDEPRWSLLIRGVDAAAGEIGSSPYEFVPAFRTIDAWNRNLPFGGHQLGRTFHAGEDYWALASGLRYIDEAIEALKLQSGDRIGHGSAMGMSPRLGRVEKPTLLEHIQNIAWANTTGPEVSRAELESWRSFYPDFPKRPAWSRYRTVELVVGPTESRWLTSLRRRVCDKVRQKGIVVESCPTSNLVIRQLASFNEVPFWGLAEAGITVTINTDNPGLLATSWHDEVMRLWEARSHQRHLVLAAVNSAPASSFLLDDNALSRLEGILGDILNHP